MRSRQPRLRVGKGMGRGVCAYPQGPVIFSARSLHGGGEPAETSSTVRCAGGLVGPSRPIARASHDPRRWVDCTQGHRFRVDAPSAGAYPVRRRSLGGVSHVAARLQASGCRRIPGRCCCVWWGSSGWFARGRDRCSIDSGSRLGRHLRHDGPWLWVHQPALLSELRLLRQLPGVLAGSMPALS
jgi:hypothetical protein